MGGFSLWHWLVVGVIILLLFGKGRFSDMMGDVAKGIKSFKKGMTEDEEAAEARRLPDGGTVQPAPARPVADDRTASGATVDARPVDPRPVDARPVDPIASTQDADRRQP